MLRFICLNVFFLGFLLALPISGQAGSSLHSYAGRYSDGKDYAVYFGVTKYGLTIRPVLWTATQLLRNTNVDSFEVVDRTSRRADFVRDGTGKVVGVNIRGMDGEGIVLRKSEEADLSIELLLNGKTALAANRYLKRGSEGLNAALAGAEKVFQRYPTKRASIVAFLHRLSPQFKRNVKFYSLLGYAQIASGKRSTARHSFEAAYAIDPTNEDAISGLARLNALPSNFHSNKAPWPLPFSLSDVFVRPTAAEIRAVETDWAARDLRPAGVREEAHGEISIDGWQADVRIISHLVHVYRNFGAIIIPKTGSTGRRPVIVDAKGVSPTYFPLQLDRIESLRTMDELKDRFVYVVPSFRGEVLNFNGKEYKSEGDRRDALDGATDDTIAFLSAALSVTPQADASRVCAFGHSRGGTVAVLAGIRDKRIRCVVNVAGPTDWFYAMGTEGWTEQELWTEAVRIHATPLETGGQDLERFMGRAIEGKADLAAVRHNMIASSPLYFARQLPLSQHHYGVEDVSVPVKNGRLLQATLRRSQWKKSVVYFYPDQGHDTDRIREPQLAKMFIAKTLNVH